MADVLLFPRNLILENLFGRYLAPDQVEQILRRYSEVDSWRQERLSGETVFRQAFEAPIILLPIWGVVTVSTNTGDEIEDFFLSAHSEDALGLMFTEAVEITMVSMQRDDHRAEVVIVQLKL